MAFVSPFAHQVGLLHQPLKSSCFSPAQSNVRPTRFQSSAAPLTTYSSRPIHQRHVLGIKRRWKQSSLVACSATPSASPSTETPASSEPKPSSASTLDMPLGPVDGTNRFGPNKWGEGIQGDLKRRLPIFVSDFTDAVNPKVIPSILFLYFACLAPVIAFGGLTSVLTHGAMGVVEFLVSASVSGVIYALFSGQPLTFIGPTGLTLAFTSALYGFCASQGLNFLGTYAWVGLWTAFNLFVLAVTNMSDIIRYCTRFTDDIFNSLIAFNFLYEATKNLLKGFQYTGMDKTKPFMATTLALGTFILARTLAEFRRSKYLRRNIRNFFSDFGPITAIIIMTLIAYIPALANIKLDCLNVPAVFTLAGGRPWLVDIFSIPVSARLFAFIPSLLLTCLFFLDQNITVRVINQPQHKLKKGPGYHLDLLVLSLVTALASIFGLPWMCAATVQSLNHVRSLATWTQTKTSGGESSQEVSSVLENRVTGVVIHGLIGASLAFLPLLAKIPMAVISGLFLFLGRNMMSGNEFLRRIRLVFMDPELYPLDSPMRKIKPTIVNMFTALQTALLAILFALKVNPKTSLFFPTIIGALMVIRSFVLDRVFPASALEVLDGELGGEDDEAEEAIAM